MLFNSIEYLFFVPLVFLLWLRTRGNLRVLVLLAASYWFYMSWNALYIFLIFYSTIVDYLVSLGLQRSGSRRVRLTLVSVSLAMNLGLLFVFKYYNFFAGSLQGLFQALTISVELPSSELLLPVGISFYTFQTLSYTIDCYRRKVNAERNFGVFALYVSFFPQLVAGPIERSGHLLPQFKAPADFDYARVAGGLRRIAWGLFKKVVVADQLSVFVDVCYANPEQFGGAELFLATFFFGFQIYCDFSGYSDIAIGTARMFGIDLMENFRNPYQATSIRAFWQRWHISLTTWFKDYVYIPLGGNRGSNSRHLVNVLIVFLVSGLWHGANWTFIIWGLVHGVAYLMYLLALPGLQFLTTRGWQGKAFRAVGWLLTLSFVNLAWVFFRSESLDAAMVILEAVAFHWTLDGMVSLAGNPQVGFNLALIVFLELVGRADEKHSLLESMPTWRPALRWSVYYAITVCILLFGRFTASPFIYFQF